MDNLAPAGRFFSPINFAAMSLVSANLLLGKPEQVEFELLNVPPMRFYLWAQVQPA